MPIKGEAADPVVERIVTALERIAHALESTNRVIPHEGSALAEVFGELDKEIAEHAIRCKARGFDRDDEPVDGSLSDWWCDEGYHRGLACALADIRGAL